MKKRMVVLIGLIMIGAIGYAHFGTVKNTTPEEKVGYTQKSNRPALGAGRGENRLHDQPASELVYAIVVMPTSYLPLLKRFSRSRIARDLKILPAKIDWNDGQPVVTPTHTGLKTSDGKQSTAEGMRSPVGAGDTGRRISENRALRNAALMLLLQGSLKGKLTYRRDRSISSASSSLHR